MFASCMPRVQLYVNACNGWPQFALQHHWLLPINCHFLRLYSAACRGIAAVSSAIEEFDFYLFTFIDSKVVTALKSYLIDNVDWYIGLVFPILITRINNIVCKFPLWVSFCQSSAEMSSVNALYLLRGDVQAELASSFHSQLLPLQEAINEVKTNVLDSVCQQLMSVINQYRFAFQRSFVHAGCGALRHRAVCCVRFAAYRTPQRNATHRIRCEQTFSLKV